MSTKKRTSIGESHTVIVDEVNPMQRGGKRAAIRRILKEAKAAGRVVVFCTPARGRRFSATLEESDDGLRYRPIRHQCGAVNANGEQCRARIPMDQARCHRHARGK